MMWWPGTAFGWIWMFVWGILGIAFWVAVIWLIVWAVRRFTEGPGARGGKSALDIVRERYARGEITREQFEQLRKDLS